MEEGEELRLLSVVTKSNKCKKYDIVTRVRFATFTVCSPTGTHPLDGHLSAGISISCIYTAIAIRIAALSSKKGREVIILAFVPPCEVLLTQWNKYCTHRNGTRTICRVSFPQSQQFRDLGFRCELFIPNLRALRILVVTYSTLGSQPRDPGFDPRAEWRQMYGFLTPLPLLLASINKLIITLLRIR